MKIYKLFMLLPLLAAMACSSPKEIVYIQDINPNVQLVLQEANQIKLQPGDKLDITIHSRDNELSQMFNINNNGSGGSTSGGSGNRGRYYTVDQNGQIDMPILGLINVKGLTRLEVANIIKYRLLSSKLIKDPTVTVNYANIGFSALGEVGSPGWHEIDRDQLTLLEAIALCGDLTINGLRENVLVLRTADGKQTPYRVNLTSTYDLYTSPAFYIQQNDMIYVEPNEKKTVQSTINGGSFRTPTFWISIFTFAMTVVAIFYK